ncbi:hypothetical protein D9X30_2329 [Cupriavidus sp. U2]|jgi:hypothetical protein|nr:hypothetical protein D9X30_2329 [Cupriavidus sp. U2]
MPRIRRNHAKGICPGTARMTPLAHRAFLTGTNSTDTDNPAESLFSGIWRK